MKDWLQGLRFGLSSFRVSASALAETVGDRAAGSAAQRGDMGFADINVLGDKRPAGSESDAAFTRKRDAFHWLVGHFTQSHIVP